MANDLKILRDADYVIPPTCHACNHVAVGSWNPNSTTVVCLMLNQEVSMLGHCKHFETTEALVNCTIRPEDRPLLEKRKYTRSNRHKANTRY